MNGTTISTFSRNEFNQLLESQEDTKSMITAEEQSPSAHEYQKGNYLIYNNQLYKVTTAIAVGDTLSTSTNIEAVDVGEELKATSGGSSAGGETISAPSLVTNTFTYDGTSKSPIFTGFDEDTMIYGNNVETNAGQYAMSVALMNGNNVWSDTDDNAPKSYLWTIQKAQATLSVSANAVTLDTEHPSVDITVTLTGDGTLSITNSDDSVCSTSMDGTTCTITATTHLLKTATLTFSANETSNWLAPADVTVDVTAAYAKIVSWAEGTDAEIVALVDLADNGYIDLYEDCGWRVGDTRTVSLSAMSATYVGESHVAQDAEFVLMHHGDMNLYNATPSGRTKCSFVVGMKNVLADGTTPEGGYMESTDTNANGWRGCRRRTWCNNVFRPAIPSTLRSMFKQFTRSVATKGGTDSSGVTLSTDYFSLPTEKNVFGTRSRCTADEFNAADNFQFEWYQTAANRVKRAGSGSSAYAWWECSPMNNSYNYFCGVNSSGVAIHSSANSASGIAPFGVI